MQIEENFVDIGVEKDYDGESRVVSDIDRNKLVVEVYKEPDRIKLPRTSLKAYFAC